MELERLLLLWKVKSVLMEPMEGQMLSLFNQNARHVHRVITATAPHLTPFLAKEAPINHQLVRAVQVTAFHAMLVRYAHS